MPRFWGILHDGNRYDEKVVFYEDVFSTYWQVSAEDIAKSDVIVAAWFCRWRLALEKFLVRLWSHIEVLSLLSLEYAFEMSIFLKNNLSSC